MVPPSNKATGTEKIIAVRRVAADKAKGIGRKTFALRLFITFSLEADIACVLHV
jgi:hypothetical protein